MIIYTAFVAAAGIGIEAGVSFIGLGDPTKASWGQTLQVSFSAIYFNKFGVLWPALVISISILCLILLGNVLSDTLQASARSEVFSARKRRKLVATAQREFQDAPVNDSLAIGSSDDVVLSLRDFRVGYCAPDGHVNEVVHGVDLDLRRGEIHGLVGESGSGKSQIAFCLSWYPAARGTDPWGKRPV